MSNPESPASSGPALAPTYREALGVWIRIALQSFGGPAGQIAVMHRILVDEKRWIDEARFLHALNYCMLLPGPEAQQLATYVGWLLHGYRGGVTAGLLFVLPGFLAILAMSLVYVTLGDVELVAGLFFGLKAAVLAIVAQAVLRIGRRVLKNGAMAAIAVAAFLGIFLAGLPFPAIVGGAAVVGLVGARLSPARFDVLRGHGGGDEPDRVGSAPLPAHRRVLFGAAVCALLWLVPIAGLWLALGREHVFVQEAVFFSKAAVVTFGGAYAVLAYMAQAAVETYHWLEPGQMLDGLSMAETTPGPLIQVVQFVGFMGAYRDPGALHPLVAGLVGSVVATWVTFAPCFLWIFLGAPYVESLRGRRSLNAALSAITAAVVGVVLNLALWFALHTCFAEVGELAAAGLSLPAPKWETADLAALALTAAALVATFRFRVKLLPLLAGCAAAGAALVLAGLA